MKNKSIKDQLKSYFNSGDVPSQHQFAELIDHALNAGSIDSGTLDNERLPADISVTNLSGIGSGLTALNADAITSGTLNNERFPANVTVQKVTAHGSGLTKLNADEIKSGTLDNAHLPANITVEKVIADGSGLTKLNADEIKSGRLDNAYLPANISVTNISGDGSGLTNLNIDQIAKATESTYGITRFATQEEASEGTLTDVAITPVTLSKVIKERLRASSPKKYVLDIDGSVTGFQEIGIIDKVFLHSDYVTTSSGKNLFITKAYQNNLLHIYEWNGSLNFIESINTLAPGSYFRVINFSGEVVLYDGDKAYLYDEQSNKFVFTGETSNFGGNKYTKYGVAFDGKNRVAMINNMNNTNYPGDIKDTKVYEVENPLNPHILSNPVNIPFPTDILNIVTNGGYYKSFSFDGSEEYGLIAYAQSQSIWQDPILVSRLKPNTTSFETVYSSLRSNGESHGGNAMVYNNKVLALHGNNSNSTFGRMDSGVYKVFQNYTGGVNGGELPVFSLKDNFYGILPSSGGSHIYQILSDTAVLKSTVPGASTSSQSIGLAIFDGEIIIVNGNTLQVHKLQIS